MADILLRPLKGKTYTKAYTLMLKEETARELYEMKNFSGLDVPSWLRAIIEKALKEWKEQNGRL